MIRLLLAAAVIACPLSANASPLDAFSDLFVFGDSTSDGGNAFALTGGTVPNSAFYPDRQFTNGDVWTTQLGLAPSALGGTNYAIGGAEAVGEGLAEQSIDLSAQIAQFDATDPVLGPNSLAAILIGGNDFSEASTAEEAALQGASVLGAVISGVGNLLAAGIDTVAVFGIFDLGRFPEVVNTPLMSAATEAAERYNDFLKATLTASFAPEQTIYVDTFGIFNTVYDNPEAFGLDPGKLTTGCIFAELNPTACTGDLGYFFQDNNHATEAVHTALAEGFVAALPAPIPLPAGWLLMLSGLAAIGLIRRQRA